MDLSLVATPEDRIARVREAIIRRVADARSHLQEAANLIEMLPEHERPKVRSRYSTIRLPKPEIFEEEDPC